MESFKDEVNFLNPEIPIDKFDKFDKLEKNGVNISNISNISYDKPEDIDESKLTGIFGNIVKKMYPNVESSRITILIQSIAIFSTVRIVDHTVENIQATTLNEVAQRRN